MMYHKFIGDREVFSTCKSIQTNKGFWISNPTDEQIAAAGWQMYVPVVETTLESVKQEKLKDLTEYDNSDNVNSFKINDITLWIKPEDRVNYLLTVEAAKDAGIEEVPFMDFTLSTNKAIEILKAISVYAMQCVAVTNNHKSTIESLNSIENVNKYDFTVEYPKKLQFTI